MPDDKQKILLLGSSGFIGSAVYNRLKDKHLVYTAGRNKEQDIFLDLNLNCADSIKDYKFSVLIHCAGVINEEIADNPDNAWKRTAIQLPFLLEQLKKGGLKQIIYISTAHVYGVLNGVITEDTRVDPRSQYALAHYVTEQIIKNTACDVIVLRPSTVYDISRNFRSFSRFGLIPYMFAEMASKNQNIVLSSTGLQKLNFVDVEQISYHIEEFIDKKENYKGFHCFNEAGEQHITVLEYAGMVKRCYETITDCVCKLTTGNIIVAGENFTYKSALNSVTNISVEDDIMETIKIILKETANY